MSKDMFNTTFERVVKPDHEGGFQADPNDDGNWTGGKKGLGTLKGTKYGIAAATYPHLEIKNLTIENARSIYYADWWLKYEMGRFRPATSYQMFDAAINHGTHNANKILQRAVGVKDDGVIGPITMAAVLAMDLDDVLMRFLGYRLRFMASLKKFNSFGAGWARRIATNLLYASEDN